MRIVLGALTAAALAFTAGVALADEVEGKIQSIDTTMKTVTVDDTTYQWSENATGVKFDELKEGDDVKVMFEPNTGNEKNDIMMISKEK